MHTAMKTLSERNPVIIGAIGVAIIAAIVTAALQYQKLPFLNRGTGHSGYFADAGGLFTGAGVEVSGYPVGKVTGIRLDGPQVLVTFTIAHNIHLGDRTEAAIRTKSLLGTKVLNVTPAGNGTLSGPIPLARTISPYQLPDALGELANTVSGSATVTVTSLVGLAVGQKVTGPGILAGTTIAAILDNNYPGRFELTPREQFIRLWAGYGGFALTVLNDPSSSLPYRSYEVIQ